jgi:hypothetical protein
MSEVINVAGKLEELDLKPTKSFNNQNFYSELLYYARMKGYKDGWAAHKFKDKTGKFPTGLSTAPAPISMETSNWVRSRLIAFAKTQGKGAYK